MPYKLNLTREAYRGGKNILAAENGLKFVEAGATIDAEAFPVGVIELGTLIARSLTTGKYEPFTAVAGYDNFGILNIDLDNDGENDIIVGEVLVGGSVYRDKLPEAPTAEFLAAAPELRMVFHV